MVQRNIDSLNSQKRTTAHGNSRSGLYRDSTSGMFGSGVWSMPLLNGFSTFALACAAAYTSTRSQNNGIGMTAWIAVAIVGTTSAIALSRTPSDGA